MKRPVDDTSTPQSEMTRVRRRSIVQFIRHPDVLLVKTKNHYGHLLVRCFYYGAHLRLFVFVRFDVSLALEMSI